MGSPKLTTTTDTLAEVGQGTSSFTITVFFSIKNNIWFLAIESVVRGPAALASPGSLEMQNLRLHPRPVESDSGSSQDP